jgi:4-amino-4-deoxy-L-arabinose transferase-like glycosyltransferase
MRGAALVLAGLTLVVFLANRQWLRECVLVNSPAYDALVYQNQSYTDYLLIRQEGPAAIWRKYTDGRWHVPPLHMLSGTLAYLLLGTDPANFHIMPAVWAWLMLLAVFGFMHYFTGRLVWAATATSLVMVVPSLVTFGLRVSQTDFSAGCAFTLATYLLVASTGLKRRGVGICYALAVSAAMLMKSSLTPYFAAHAGIWAGYAWLDRCGLRRRLANAALAVLMVAALAGWYYVANYRRIIGYYTEWGTTLSRLSQERFGLHGAVDHLLFYLRALHDFHLSVQGFWLYVLAVCLCIILLTWAAWRTRSLPADGRLRLGLVVALVWLVVPYGILTVYASKARTVDYPFLAAWFIIPVLAVAAAVPRRRALLAALLIFGPGVLGGVAQQTQNLATGRAAANWREAEILGDILADAEARGLERVVVSNTFVDRYLTSENLSFFVLNGTYPQWRGRYAVAALGYYDRAEDFYHAVSQADYVLARAGGPPLPYHPDNQLTPAVNGLVAASPDFVEMSRFALPDTSQLTVYRHQGRQRLRHDVPNSDGWITGPFAVDIYGQARDVQLRLSGRMPLPQAGGYPAALLLRNAAGRSCSEAVVTDSEPFVLVLRVPAVSLTGAPDKTRFWLDSPSAFRPNDVGTSQDDRRLLLLLDSLELADVEQAAP